MNAKKTAAAVLIGALALSTGIAQEAFAKFKPGGAAGSPGGAPGGSHFTPNGGGQSGQAGSGTTGGAGGGSID